MQLCAITNRISLTGPRANRPAAGGWAAGKLGELLETEKGIRKKLRELVAAWIDGGVDFIQLREKDLDAGALRLLAQEIFAGLDRRSTRLLINFPSSAQDLELLAPIADGIHVPGPPYPGSASRVRHVFRSIGRTAIVSMSCHSAEEVRAARAEQADLVLFAPVFEKKRDEREEKQNEQSTPAQGLDVLHLACKAAGSMPVFALGGVTAATAHTCIAAGARGVAGIRLFAGDDWRRLSPSAGAQPIYR
jgi:thiamine-phosphate pyrophosphorylase